MSAFDALRIKSGPSAIHPEMDVSDIAEQRFRIPNTRYIWTSSKALAGMHHTAYCHTSPSQ